MKTWKKVLITIFFILLALGIWGYPKFKMLNHVIHLFDDDKIVENFRQVVPNGSASVPVRRLNAMLGSGGKDKKISQSIYLLSKIAPALTQLKIDLSTLNYSNREQILRINIKADSFSGVEQLRQALDKQGVVAELQSSNATDDGFQARLKISMRDSQNG